MACDLTSLVQASKCFDCLSELEKKAVAVYLYAQALKAGGGADYTNPNTLREAAKCFNCELEDSRMQSFEDVIAKNAAVAAGFTGSTVVSDLVSAAKLLINGGSIAELNAMEFLLVCNLSIT